LGSEKEYNNQQWSITCDDDGMRSSGTHQKDFDDIEVRDEPGHQLVGLLAGAQPSAFTSPPCLQWRVIYQ
jgi:hypothetical protein